MENLNKRKWSVWLWLLAIKPLIDIIMLFFISDMVSRNRDYESLSSFISVSILLSVVICIIAFVGTSINISKVFRDGRFELKYRFWSMGLIALLTAIFSVAAGAFYDMAEFGLVYLENEAANEEAVGHGAPAFTIGFLFIGFIYVIVAGIVGIVVQAVYKGKKK